MGVPPLQPAVAPDAMGIPPVEPADRPPVRAHFFGVLTSSPGGTPIASGYPASLR
jgi:hypothetical protein